MKNKDPLRNLKCVGASIVSYDLENTAYKK